jgi:hypothetical protein
MPVISVDPSRMSSNPFFPIILQTQFSRSSSSAPLHPLLSVLLLAVSSVSPIPPEDLLEPLANSPRDTEVIEEPLVGVPSIVLELLGRRALGTAAKALLAPRLAELSLSVLAVHISAGLAMET